MKEDSQTPNIDVDTQYWVDIVERNKLTIADAIRRCSWADDAYYRPYKDNIPIYPLRNCELVFRKESLSDPQRALARSMGKPMREDDVRQFAMVYLRKHMVRNMETDIVAVERRTLDGLLALEKL